MPDYTFSVGTHDPYGFSAASDGDAVRQAVGIAMSRHAEDLRHNPQDVATLMGPAGLLTRPSERVDEFVARLAGTNPLADATVIQTGDTNTPDCNGD